jgi:hypothetical protein
MKLHEINQKYSGHVAQTKNYILSDLKKRRPITCVDHRIAQEEAEYIVYRDIAEDDGVSQIEWHCAHAPRFLEMEQR